jgi:hypothetical protein
MAQFNIKWKLDNPYAPPPPLTVVAKECRKKVKDERGGTPRNC